MTHTDPTARDLLRGVLLRPDDDTARLVYADRLDDIGQHERAELIRVQCELARLHEAGHGTQPEDGPPCPAHSFARKQSPAGAQVTFACAVCSIAFEREARADELLTDRRAEWFGIKCPACEGSGNQPGDLYDLGRCEGCEGCDGDGFAPVAVRRGFVYRVECRMRDALEAVGDSESGNTMAWALTPWAADVLAAHPVTEWGIVDLTSAGELPRPVYDECRKIDPQPAGMEIAIRVIERAVGRVARARWLAGLREVTP